MWEDLKAPADSHLREFRHASSSPQSDLQMTQHSSKTQNQQLSCSQIPDLHKLCEVINI